MWRQKLARCAIVTAFLLMTGARAGAAEDFTVRILVPTLAGLENLGTNVSTLLALRLWTTFRPRPHPNPRNLYFGYGQFRSSRVIEDSPEAALQAAHETESDLAWWGEISEYGSGILVAANLVIPEPAQPAAASRQRWTVAARGQKLELGLPSSTYQFSPLILDNEVVAKYSRPSQIRLCQQKTLECKGAPLGPSFRSIRIDGDFVLVRRAAGDTGWVALPNLSQAQGEVIDFTAALFSYLRGDFEQASSYFARVRDSGASGPVRNDAALLAGIALFRDGKGLEALRAAHLQNPYSRYGMQALVMADIATADARPTAQLRDGNLSEARRLVETYRHLFAPGDPWLRGAERCLRDLGSRN